MNDKRHAFSIELANEYGVNCALILEHLYFWISKNKENQKAFRSDEYWMFQSVSEMHNNTFTYLTPKQIRNALNKLESKEIIKSSKVNSWDQTKWYTFTQKGKCILQKVQMDIDKRANAIAKKDKPIKDTKKDTKKIYGEYKHVRLSDSDIEELNKLTNDLNSWITKLDEYIELKNPEYKNHCLVLKQWIDKDKEKNKRTYEYDY